MSYDAADQTPAGPPPPWPRPARAAETLTQSFSGTGGSANPDGQLTGYGASYSGSCSGLDAAYQRDYSYDPAGRVVYQGSTAQGSNPNNFAYDPSGDPTTISAHNSAGNFDSYSQSFDHAGELDRPGPGRQLGWPGHHLGRGRPGRRHRHHPVRLPGSR